MLELEWFERNLKTSLKNRCVGSRLDVMTPTLKSILERRIYEYREREREIVKNALQLLTYLRGEGIFIVV